MPESATILWIDQFGSGYAWDVALDSSGIYVVGQTNGLAAEPHEAFVRKYVPNGSVVWAHEFTTQAVRDDYPKMPAAAHGVAVDPTGVYVVGTAGYNLPSQAGAAVHSAFVRKYDASGNEVWTRQFGTRSGALGVAADFTGVYVVGCVKETDQEGVPVDAFVCKYDTSGNKVWTRQFGSSADDVAHRVAVNSTGVYVVGKTVGALPGQNSAGGSDAFVRKYDTSGNEVWTRQFAGSADDVPHRATVRSQGVYAVGKIFGAQSGQRSTADSDTFVRRYNIKMKAVVPHWIGTPATDEAVGVGVDSTGAYVVAQSLPPGDIAVFVHKFAPNGSVIWTRKIGLSAVDAAGGVWVDSTGVYVAGTIMGPPFGGTDFFVRKYDTHGDEVWTHEFGSPVEYVLGIAVNLGLYVVGKKSGAFIARLSLPEP